MKKIIFFALLLTGAAWAAKFNEPDADKNHVRIWNEKIGRNAWRVSKILTQENPK